MPHGFAYTLADELVSWAGIRFTENKDMNSRPEALCQEGAMTISESGRFTGWSRSYLYQLMDLGALPYVKHGRTRRIPRRALVQLLATNLRGGSQLESSAEHQPE